MSFANPLPWWALAIVTALAALVAWQAYRRLAGWPGRRAALTALRFVTLLLLVVFLMRPVVRGAGSGAREAVVPILVDTSRSMSIEDVDGRRRLVRARELVERDLLPSLGAEFEVELLAFGEGLEARTPGELAATGRRSDLAGALSALRDRYRGRAVAGIVLLSDGGDTGAAAAVDIPAPVFAVGIGSPTGGRDREVLSITAAEAVLEDSRADIAVSAVSHGAARDPFDLRLLENGRPIEVRRVTPAGAGIPIRELFRVSPRRGAATVYTVEIPPAAGEAVPENNARSVLVQPPARPRRVLLVEGAPGFEHSFLKRALAGDKGLEIDSSVRKGRNEQGTDTYYIQAARGRGQALAAGYPIRREDLFQYDAVLFANVDAAQLTGAQAALTRAFVAERGGGVMVLGAKSFARAGLAAGELEDILPLDTLGRGSGGAVPASNAKGLNRVGVTDAGSGHPVMQLDADAGGASARWDAVPSLASVAPVGGPRPGATVLAVTAGAGGTPRVLVAVQRYGEGRTMSFTGEATWRWRMMLPASNRVYDTFWRQAIRWLALPAADPIAITVPAGAAPGDPQAISVLVRSAAFEPAATAIVDVQVSAPDGRLERLRAAAGSGADAGRYSARFTPQQPGVYRVTADASAGGAPLGTASTALLVGGADPEMTDPRLNTRVLQRLTAASGGRLLSDGELGTLVERLRDATPAATLATQRDLWHNGWSFTVVVLLLAVEWILRRRWGLR